MGVDIFLFLSAVGLYYSMKRRPSLLLFYKKRFFRVLLPTFLVSAVWFAAYSSSCGREYLENILLISFWKNGLRYEWFIALILPLYIIFPFLFWYQEKYKKIGMALLIGGIICINAYLKTYNLEFYKNVEIALLRIPIFLIGMGMAGWIYNEKQVPLECVILAGIVFCLFSWFYLRTPQSNPWNRYLYIPIAVSFVIVSSSILHKIKKQIKWIYNFLIWLGGYTLEIYLVHEKVLIVLQENGFLKDRYNLAINISGFILATVIAVGIGEFDKNILKQIEKPL